MLRTIVSKHLSNISAAIQPVLPSVPATPTSLQASTNAPTVECRTGYSSSIAQNAAAVENEAVSESHETHDTETYSIQEHVRHLMRRVPHPVAIITSTDPNAPVQTAFRGMTVSSFNTVTLYPDPVVSFNAKVPSETYNAILSSSRFLVHLLAPNPTTARLAREFSKGQENISLRDEDKFFQFVSPHWPRSLSPSIRTGEPPRLVIRPTSQQTNASTSGAITTEDETVNFPFIFECKYLPQSCRVGDHVVVLGTVVRVLQKETSVGAALRKDRVTPHFSEELCLTYADTQFWKMGEIISPGSKAGGARR
ncbi:hypothetical protein VTO42DRAFT_5060 [Malbranchea cinnamomea]